MATKALKIWRFEDAPTKYRKLSTNGGDEDWLVFIPNSVAENVLMYGMPYWMESMGCCSTDSYTLPNGDVVVIASHA
jgi:hypothetical protein